jgi:hypothetical protein
MPPEACLSLALVVLVPYIVLLGTGRRVMDRFRLPPRWVEWLTSAVLEEEAELVVAVHPGRGTPTDTLPQCGRHCGHQPRKAVTGDGDGDDHADQDEG